MANLQSFDPSFFLSGTHNMCEQLRDKDCLDTDQLVENVYQTMIDHESKLHQGIFAILSETGEGKTFFLALLYCLLKEHRHTVHYIDILEYVVRRHEERLLDDMRALCKRDDTIVILIDNVDKYAPRVILDFMYQLSALVRKENILCILTYDEQILLRKLDSVYGGGDEMQTYFQNFIDIEYFLINKNADSRANEKIFWGIHPITVLLFEEVFNELRLTLLEKNTIAKKVRFYIQNNRDNDSLLIRYLPYVFYLVILKIRDKQRYRELLKLKTMPSDEKELPLFDEILKPMLEKKRMIRTTEEGYGESTMEISPQDSLRLIRHILHQMELTHV